VPIGETAYHPPVEIFASDFTVNHPFSQLLQMKAPRQLWVGHAVSSVGQEIAYIALVWIGIELVGTNIGYLQSVQYAGLLVVTLGAGAFIDRIPPAFSMIVICLLSALLSVMLVIWFNFTGPAVLPLVVTAVGLSSLNAIYLSVLLSSIPKLAPTQALLQAINGLFDASSRLSRLLGPSLAGVLVLLLPIIHFFSLNAIAFLLLALAIWQVRASLQRAGEKARAAELKLVARLLRGVSLVRQHRDIQFLLASNLLAIAAWNMGVVLGIAIIFKTMPPKDLLGTNLTSFGFVMAAYGCGDLLSNILVSAWQPKRRWTAMCCGYVVLGGGLTLIPLTLMFAPHFLQLPAIVCFALISGLGGPMFYLPMITRVQSRFSDGDLAAVIRLRLAGVGVGLLLSALISPFLFDQLGILMGTAGAGIMLIAIGLAGALLESQVTAKDQSAGGT
jgi:MFS family permease